MHYMNRVINTTSTCIIRVMIEHYCDIIFRSNMEKRLNEKHTLLFFLLIIWQVLLLVKHNFIFKSILSFYSLFLGTHILFMIVHHINNKQNNFNSITQLKNNNNEKTQLLLCLKEHIHSYSENPKNVHLDYK